MRDLKDRIYSGMLMRREVLNTINNLLDKGINGKDLKEFIKYELDIVEERLKWILNIRLELG